jgi:hypothetical protein
VHSPSFNSINRQCYGAGESDQINARNNRDEKYRQRKSTVIDVNVHVNQDKKGERCRSGVNYLSNNSGAKIYSRS